ncbi:permease prefix domain 1-containing protein [Amphibacillus xylanus]|uniref:Uncharacterized protein n=1 Tax=Amphibacillus xylanus (strain ATCC 51415 / DSM 6626 / JCM 7361 / LMG 17667 / NBRC 15112 / Ep01) TaxID=698758 RepID=K0J3U8_AMPXN|nr:permease prefix domain 1-containing protein [Amphibacillus xylanus]BAM47847.1 hypothetical protein AXY_17150 [Amphibacillus xylanus NBRC 15112]
MDTIMSYLETMFAKLPKTPEVEQIKQELSMNMEEKYHELINLGKTENEAIGTVISEFGNIDELMEELGYAVEEEAERALSDQEVNDFLAENKHFGKMIGIGVSLILLAASIFMLINGVVSVMEIENRLLNIAGLIPLLLMVAVSVAIFIVADHRMEPFKAMLHNYQITPNQRYRLEQEANEFRSDQLKAVVIGVVLCIVAPLVLIIISVVDGAYASIGVSILLGLIAIAIFLFIYYGEQDSAYKKLLQEQNYQKPNADEEDKVVGAVAAFVWPLAVAIFLITGFIFNQWHINWLIFPITGLLFGGFAAVRSIMNED